MARQNMGGTTAEHKRRGAASRAVPASRASSAPSHARALPPLPRAILDALVSRPGAVVALLSAISLLVYAVQGGLAERVYTTWQLANQWDRTISATMPLATLFRDAVAWVPRRLPAPLPGSASAASPFLMAIWSYFAAVALLFALYLLALRWLTRHPSSPRDQRRQMAIIAGAAALFGVLLLFTPAAPSHDPIAYASAGRLLGSHGANPFFVVPSAYPRDPVLAANEWPISTTAYGPLWTLLSLALNPLVAGDPLRANFIYRVVALLAELANIALVAALVTQLPSRFGAWRARGLLLYAWNPLVVIEVAAGHNDVLMLTFLLLGVLLLARGRPYWGMASLGGAVLLKVNALPLVLVIVLAGWLVAQPATGPRDWRGWRRGLAPAAVALGVVLAGYLPFYWNHSLATISAASTLQPTSQALNRALLSSFGTLAGSGAVRALPGPLATALASAIVAASNPTFWTLVLGLGLLFATFLLLPRLRTPERIAPVLAWVYAVWMVFLCVFHLLRTWYLIPLVGLVCLTPAGRPIRRFVIALTASMQVGVLFLSRAPPFNGWQPWALLLVLGPPLFVLAVEVRGVRWDWRAAARASFAQIQARLGIAQPLDGISATSASPARVGSTAQPFHASFRAPALRVRAIHQRRPRRLR